MITFEEATRIAKETKKVNYYQEFKDVYVYGDENVMLDDGEEQEMFGGVDAPIVIMKSTGKVIGFSAFAVRHPEKVDPDKVIREGQI